MSLSVIERPPGPLLLPAEVPVVVRCDAHQGNMPRPQVQVLTFDVSRPGVNDMMIGYACTDFRSCIAAARRDRIGFYA